MTRILFCMKRTPMRVAIPEEMREQLEADTFMKVCIISRWPIVDYCEGRIEWNHGFSYAGKRRNELWAILPMCHRHHEKEAKYRVRINTKIRERITYFNAIYD